MTLHSDYDRIWYAPRQCATLRHRSEANTRTTAFNATLDLPIITAPMPDVCNGKMARTFSMHGGLALIHRFQSIAQQVKNYNDAITDNPRSKQVGCAIGTVGDWAERFEELYAAGCRIFCIDTANGYNEQVSITAYTIKQAYDDIYIIAGNIATGEGYKYLATLGVKIDAVRVGIAGGSVCETKNETGVYMPIIASLRECVAARATLDVEAPLIIADGGIKKPADANKALGLGADLVMCGSLFAGTAEAPGDVIKHDGQLYKLYRGAASFSVQHEFTNKEPQYNEGAETLVPYKGTVVEILHRLRGGLTSCMSYNNARTLQELRNNATFYED